MSNTQNPQSPKTQNLEVNIPQNQKVVANLKLKKSEKEEYLKKLKKIPFLTQFLRYVALIGFVLSLGWWWWLVMDLDPENIYLSSYGISPNRFQEYESLKTKKENKLKVLEALKEEIQTIQKQIENQEYSLYTNQIRKLESQQKIFFDVQDEIEPFLKQLQKTNPENVDIALELAQKTPTSTEKKELKQLLEDSENIAKIRNLLESIGFSPQVYGLLEAPLHVQSYLTDPDFSDDIILKTAHNDLSIQDITINNDVLSFNMEGTNLHGTTFYLYTEFLEVLNSFPFFENGILKNFQKQKDEENNFIMKTDMRFDIREKPDTDEEKTFFDFQNWYNEKNGLSTSSQRLNLKEESQLLNDSNT